MSVLRIIDANANRAREALRVMEEAARFLLEDDTLTAEIKALRHDLMTELRRLDGLDASRDTPGDVGTVLSTPTEMTRSSVAEVVIAAGKRLSEALRAIEEYAKGLGSDLPERIEPMRYRGYDLEQRLNRALGSGRARQWRICVLLSADSCGPREWTDVAAAVCDAAPDCIQLREKALDDGELLRRARWLVERADQRTSIVVNDRPDIALLAGAHGVHLGQTDVGVRDVRRLVGRRLLVGVSTAHLAAARQALRDGADYCGVGPMFPSTTKHKDVIVGPAYLREYVAWGKLPHLAIGGITAENVGELIAVGGRGVAVSAAVCAAADPAAEVQRLDHAIEAGAATADRST